MLFVFLSLIVTVGLFVGLGFCEDPNIDYIWKLNKKQLFAVFGLSIMLLGCITKIPANHVGIVYSPFGGTKEQTLTEGFQTKNVLDKIYKISTEVQTMPITNLTTQTKDAQYLTSALDVKYKVSASNAFLIFKHNKTPANTKAPQNNKLANKPPPSKPAMNGIIIVLKQRIEQKIFKIV